MRNKFIKGFILTIAIGSAFLLGANTKQHKEAVTIDRVLYESTDTFAIEDGEIGIEFSDGSWASMNESKGYYTFQQYNLGDYSLEFDNKEDLKKCIIAYLENNNQ